MRRGKKYSARFQNRFRLGHVRRPDFKAIRPQGHCPTTSTNPSAKYFTFENPTFFDSQIHNSTHSALIMAETSLADIIAALPSEDSWGPPTSTETTLNGVPYAPYSKGDKLGRMADWTAEGKDGRDGRGGRQQYNRNYRGMFQCLLVSRIHIYVFGTAPHNLQYTREWPC
jgi:hypothetical protein